MDQSGADFVESRCNPIAQGVKIGGYWMNPFHNTSFMQMYMDLDDTQIITQICYYLRLVTVYSNNSVEIFYVFKKNKQEYKHGPFALLYPDGRIKTYGIYYEGSIYGTVYSYYPNGNIKHTTTFIDGKKHGYCICYHEDFNITVIKYENDVRVGIEPLDENIMQSAPLTNFIYI